MPRQLGEAFIAVKAEGEHEFLADVKRMADAAERISVALTVLADTRKALADTEAAKKVMAAAVTIPENADTRKALADTAAAKKVMAAAVTIPETADTRKALADTAAAKKVMAAAVQVPVTADTARAVAGVTGLRRTEQADDITIPVHADTSPMELEYERVKAKLLAEPLTVVPGLGGGGGGGGGGTGGLGSLAAILAAGAAGRAAGGAGGGSKGTDAFRAFVDVTKAQADVDRWAAAIEKNTTKLVHLAGSEDEAQAMLEGRLAADRAFGAEVSKGTYARARLMQAENKLAGLLEAEAAGGGFRGLFSGGIGGKAAGFAGKAPWWLGAGLAGIPAIATLGGVGVAAGIGLGGAGLAGGLGLGAFGAFAGPAVADALKAEQAVTKAQDDYNAAIKAGTPHAQAYKAEQLAIARAYEGMSPAQVGLSRQLGTMAAAWDKLKAAQAPVVSAAVTPWLKAITDLMHPLARVFDAVAPVIGSLGRQFDVLVNSPAFTKFTGFIAGTGSHVAGVGGRSALDVINGLISLLPQFAPLFNEAADAVGHMADKFEAWATSAQARKEIAAFLAWVHDNGHTVGDFLKSIGGALGTLLPGLAAGGQLELQALTGLLNLIASLPPGVAAPLAEVVGAVLILSKIPGGKKAITFAVNVIGAGAGLLLKLLGIGTGKIGVELGAAGMQRAGDTMVTAAAAMQRAADTMLGADVAGGGAGGLGGAAEKGVAGKATGILGKARGLAALGGPVGIGVLGGLEIANLVDPYHRFDKPPPPEQTGPRGFAPPSSQAWKTWGNDVASSYAKAVEASHAASGKISADFTRQQQAAKSARGDLDTYTDSVTKNGANSLATRFARGQLITDLVNAGVKSSVAQHDVDAYSTAVQKNGAQSDQAKAARQRLLTDILNASANSKQGKTDLNTYTDAVRDHGVKSDAARAARKRLIQDLIDSGVDAKTATGLVDGLGRSVTKLPSGKAIKINVTGAGRWSVSGPTRETGLAHGPQNIGAGPGGFAAGGLIQAAAGMYLHPNSGVPGRDSVLIRAMPGELVVPVNMVPHVAPLLSGAIPGFAAGGVAGSYGPGGVGGLTPWLAGRSGATELAIAQATADATLAAMRAAQAAQASLGVSGAGPVGGDQAVNLALARSMFPWDASQWPAFNTLEMHEAGYNRFARNASSGAYGIPQALPPTKMPFAAQAAGGSHAGPQLAWMFAYIRSVYGTPANAWAKYYAHPGGVGWYARGGLVGVAEGLIPAMAAGGAIPAGGTSTQAGLRFWLGAAQYGERRDYLGLAHAFAAGPARYRTATVRAELATLAKRQAAEQAAYAHLAGSGLTAANMHKLGLAAKAEETTARDKALSHLPGGHPGWVSGLEHYLGQLVTLSAKKVPPPPQTIWTRDPDLSALLAAAQAESTAFWRLAGDKLPKTATRAQRRDLAAWDRVLGRQQVHTFGFGKGGLFQQLIDSFHNRRTPPWTAFGSAVDYLTKEVEGTGIPGGINPPGTPRDSGWVPWHYFHRDWQTLLTALRTVKSKLTGAAPWKPGSLGASHTAPDGVLTFDRGGTLPPGLSLSYNGLGRPEHLTPDSGGGGITIVVNVENRGWIGDEQELQRWLVRQLNQLARTGSLAQAIRTGG